MIMQTEDTTFNTVETIKNLIEVHSTTESSKREAMQPLVAEFGEAALLNTKDGGINRNAFRDGTSNETRQKAADQCGLSLEKAESLARIIREVNAHRATLWQDYQIAQFGIEKIKPTKTKPAPSAESLERKARADERTEHRDNARKLRSKAKIAAANATIAAASGDKDKQGEFKREAEEWKEKAKAADANRKIRHSRSLLRASSRIRKQRLLDKTIALRDAIEAAKITEGDVNSMTIGDLIDQPPSINPPAALRGGIFWSI